jgi:hypothetical protein
MDMDGHHGQRPRCNKRPFRAAQIAEKVASGEGQAGDRIHKCTASYVQRLRDLLTLVRWHQLGQHAGLGSRCQQRAGNERTISQDHSTFGTGSVYSSSALGSRGSRLDGDQSYRRCTEASSSELQREATTPVIQGQHLVLDPSAFLPCSLPLNEALLQHEWKRYIE